MTSIKCVCLCIMLVLPSVYSAETLAQLAKLAGIDLSDIGGISDNSDEKDSSASKPKSQQLRPPPIAGLMNGMGGMEGFPMSQMGPFGGFQTFPGFEDQANFGGMSEMSGETQSMSASTNQKNAKNSTATGKPSCGGCGKPGCPECAGKLGIGMTPPPEYGGFPMASGVEGGEEGPSFDGVQGMPQGMGFDFSAAFQPSMNGFGGPFGGYGASAPSFMNPSTFVPFAAAHSMLASHGLTDGSPLGYEGLGGGETSPMNGGFGMPFAPEPYPMRGGHSRGPMRHRSRPSREPEQDYEPNQQNYEGPPPQQDQQEQGGYDDSAQDGRGDSRGRNYPPSQGGQDYERPRYEREEQPQRGPPGPGYSRPSGHPPAGRYEYD